MVVAAALECARQASGRTRLRSTRSAAAAAADRRSTGPTSRLTADRRRVAVAFAGDVQAYRLAVHGGYFNYTDTARGVLARCSCGARAVLASSSRHARA